MSHRVRFQVFEGEKELFSCEVPAHRAGRDVREEILKRLVCHFGLLPGEIVGSSLNNKRGGPHKMPLLEIARDVDPEKRSTTLSCGTNPYAIATVIGAKKQ